MSLVASPESLDSIDAATENGLFTLTMYSKLPSRRCPHDPLFPQGIEPVRGQTARMVTIGGVEEGSEIWRWPMLRHLLRTLERH